jgi:Xaa-Pro aminopeptidase/Xaa-Pro dipeptidase
VPPTKARLESWLAADRAARPARLARLRERLAREGLDGYYGVRPEHARYLTGFALRDGEEKVAGQSGQFLVSADETVVFADSRYPIQAAEEAPDSRVEAVYHDLPGRWPELLAGLRPIDPSLSRPARVAVEAAFVSHATWQGLEAAEPRVELVPVTGWIEAQRQEKEPAEIERIAAACAVADAALEQLLPRIRPGATERELALELEWQMRTNGADGLAFEPTCLGGSRAALPHGSPSDRAIRAGEVLLFDFGARVGGYRSDMTRTLFVGEPGADDRRLYGLVAAAQQAAFDVLEAALAAGRRPTNREVDAAARDVIAAAGHAEHFGHGLGHGIGLATHELPSLSFRAADEPLPETTVFSVEPGVYLAGRTGVRIEDLVAFDVTTGRLERLTCFSREVTVVGG